MKNIKIIFFLLFATQIYSQGSNLYGNIIYEQTINNSENKIIKDYTLFFNRSESYYVESVPDDLSKGQINNDDGTIFLKTRDTKKPQFYYKKFNNDFYFSEIYYNKHLLVKDSLSLIWQIKEETKIVGKYECKKATLNFRGRNYTAWFTHLINVPYRPWKLFGLNGLILEIYDDKGFISIKARKIKIETSSIQDNSIPKINTAKALNIKQFLERKQELQDVFIAKLNSKLPKGIKPFKIDKNCTDCGKELELYDENN